MSDSEWFGEPHILRVFSVDPPIKPFYDGVLDYEIDHPESCKLIEHTDGPISWSEYECDISWNLGNVGLEFSLNYSGTPIKEPGTYRIQAWGTKTYYWNAGGFEYDTGIGVMEKTQ